jgi:hypothetical protein
MQGFRQPRRGQLRVNNDRGFAHRRIVDPPPSVRRDGIKPWDPLQSPYGDAAMDSGGRQRTCRT